MGTSSTSRSKKTPKRLINWFEIPVLDLERAKYFYGHLYNVDMDIANQSDYSMAMLPVKSGVGGALVKGPGCVPSEYGSLIYLNATEDIDKMLIRIEEAGGRVVMGETLISEEMGSFALFIDSEGNKLALHSNA